jgi:adenosine kinase
MNLYFKNTLISGSVGTDAEGEIYEEMMASEGVIGFYEYCDEPTAQCLVLVNGKNRSLVTKIGAANCLTQNILDTAICNKALNSAEIFYIAGFSLSLEKCVVQRFVEASKNKTLVLNLSAPFVSEKFCDIINPIIGQADFVIGNESEVNAFVKPKEFNQEKDDEVKAKYFASKLFTKNSNQTLIVTRGENSILLVTVNTLEKIEVPKIDVKDIKDTNGAGDAFVGGFISKLAEGKTIRECIEYGIDIAQLVLRQVGCILPKNDVCNRI